LGADVVDGGGAEVGAGGEGAVEVEDVLGVGAEVFGDGGEVELVEGSAGLVGLGDGEADEFVGLAEGDALEDEVVGEVGGEEHGIGGGGEAAVSVDLQFADHLGVHGEGELDGVDGIEEGFLVLLQVAVVGEGEALERGEHGDEVAEEAPGFAAGEFADVGIFFLWHQRRTGGVGVAEGGKTEFGGAPEDEVLAEAGEVGAAEGEGEEDFGDVVAVGDGVHRVGGGGVEAELLGDGGAVEVDGGAGEGTGAEGADVEAMATAGEALAVALDHFDVGEEVVSGGDRLAALEVGVAGHDGVGVECGAVEEGGLEGGEEVGDGVDLGAAVEAGVGGDLVVAGAGGVEFASGGSDLFGEGRLDVHVDVLQFDGELEFAGGDVLFDFTEAGFDLGELVGGEETGVELGPGMGDGAGDVVGVQAPVVGDGLSVLLDEISGLFLESAFPHGVGDLGG